MSGNQLRPRVRSIDALEHDARSPGAYARERDGECLRRYCPIFVSSQHADSVREAGS